MALIAHILVALFGLVVNIYLVAIGDWWKAIECGVLNLALWGTLILSAVDAWRTVQKQ